MGLIVDFIYKEFPLESASSKGALKGVRQSFEPFKGELKDGEIL